MKNSCYVHNFINWYSLVAKHAKDESNSEGRTDPLFMRWKLRVGLCSEKRIYSLCCTIHFYFLNDL